ncbi:hypothetical protein ACFC1L_44420 [Streptomyces sp. NPDC056210]|uniref:hypothetical protein n=1 Tax=Streptomyces TaxID=1883 RepID=UPI0035D9F47E
MGDLRVKRVLRRVPALLWARLGYAAGCTTAAAGVALEFGPGWGLMVGGATAAASCLLLVDVDSEGGEAR